MKMMGIKTLLLAGVFVALQAASAQAGPSLCNGAPNGIIDGNEQCEIGACCTAKCELLPAATVCRQGNGQCDPAETCGEQTPASVADCPADVVTPNGGACQDGLFCTVDETCTDGVCGGGVPNTCDDENSCTTDTCKEANDTCQHANASNGTPCDDGSLCTTGDTCTSGVCAGGPAVTCNDDNACTDDACNPATGLCDFTNNAAPCDDGLFCTSNDACSGGVCTGGAAPSCDDGDSCTVDVCDEEADSCGVGGTAPDGTPCDDGLFCTVDDACTAGACVGPNPNPNLCDDSNVCTSDSCNEGNNSCKNTNANNGGSCDDGFPCT
ncbi:MAG: hypothetical protein ABR538_15255, partial [Candidatus Binatia bacterium]